MADCISVVSFECPRCKRSSPSTERPVGCLVPYMGSVGKMYWKTCSPAKIEHCYPGICVFYDRQ